MPGPTQNSASDADQAEFRALREGESSIAAAALDEQMAGEADTFADGFGLKVPDWEAQQVGVTEITGKTIRVVESRLAILGEELYPFTVNRSSLKYKPSENGVYEYLLATSEAAAYPERQHRELLRHFERLVRDLLKSYLGNDAVGVRVGWPSESLAKALVSDAPPTGGIYRRIAWMKGKCDFSDDEWTFDPGKHIEVVRRKAKDARIDVVVRRPLFDQRPGGMTLIAQCGCGKHDVDESSRKHTELSDNWLEFFFGRTSTPRPQKVFATSQHVVNETDLYLKQKENEQLVLDRVRLVKMAQLHPEAVEGHIDKIKALTSRITDLG